MVNLMGAGYVVEYCISRFQQKQEEKQYRAYMTDVLMAVNNNLANFVGGTVILERFADMGKPADTRTGDDIAVDVMRAAGLKFAEADNE